MLVRIKRSSNIARCCFPTFSGTSAADCMFSSKKQKRQYRLMFWDFFKDLRSRLHGFESKKERVRAATTSPPRIGRRLLVRKVAKSDGVLVLNKKKTAISLDVFFSGTSAAVCMFSAKKTKTAISLDVFSLFVFFFF